MRVLCVLSCLLLLVASASAQVPSLINYQGKLLDGTNLVNGTTTMVFRLYGSYTGPDVVYIETQTVTVVDGLYATRFGGLPDYGTLAAAVTNQPIYIEVQVGSTVMSPRERVAAVAYAQIAKGVEAGGVTSEMLANFAVTSNKIANNAVGNNKLADGAVDTAEIADGAIRSWNLADDAVTSNKIAANSVTAEKIFAGAVTAAKIATGAVGNSELASSAVDTDEIVDGAVTRYKLQDTYWDVDGNAGTTSTVHFVGTTDDEPLVFKVDGETALRLQPSTTYTPNLIGGDSANTVSNNAYGSAIAGGGSATMPNRVSDTYGFVGAGFGNVAGDGDATVSDAQCASVLGGRRNTASGYSSAVGGGDDNGASGQAAFVGGGRTNAASGSDSCIAGGKNNVVGGSQGAIGGGSANTVTGMFSVIAGGVLNVVGLNDGVIAGGSENEVHGFAGAIVGGAGNLIAEGQYSIIGGGMQNRIYGDNGVIGGGTNNYVGSTSRAGVIGGGEHNTIEDFGSVVAGGADNEATSTNSVVAGGHVNSAVAPFSFVGGGEQNDANGHHSVVAGGLFCQASTNYGVVGGGFDCYAIGEGATVAGGMNNQAKLGSSVGGGSNNYAKGEFCTIGGGIQNTATGRYATVGGGYDNTARCEAGTVGGGMGNIAGSNYAVVAGGLDNLAHGEYAAIPGGRNCAANFGAFAAGWRAKAGHIGAFVWADTNDVDFTSESNCEFSVRCTGGARFVSAINGVGTPVAGVRLASGGGSWSSLSDARVKENLRDVDEVAILETLSSVPVTTWNLISQNPSVRHIGPMAQDFNRAFGYGEQETYINDSDARGVTMAAVQGLYKMVKDLQAENRELRQELEALKAR